MMAECSILIKKSSDYLHLELPQLGNMMVVVVKNDQKMRTFAASNTEYNVVRLSLKEIYCCERTIDFFKENGLP